MPMKKGISTISDALKMIALFYKEYPEVAVENEKADTGS